MEIIKVEDLSFSYPTRTDMALFDVNLKINQGDIVLICGKSGSGKTTLLRLLKPVLAPAGERGGKVYFKGKPLSDYENREQTAEIGFVMQNPENQIVTDKVYHELAFGLENLGLKTPEIRARVSEMASFFGIENWFYKKVTELSGGQKQLLNLASVMVMQPSVLILDEPTSQLDPISAQDFLKMLEKINRELGTTIIFTEHRLEDAFSIATRVIVLDKKIIADEKPREILNVLKNIDHDMYKALPTPMRVYGSVKNSLPCPVTVSEGRAWLEEYSKTNTLHPELILKPEPQKEKRETVVEIKDAWFRYEKKLPDVIKGLNLEVYKGEIFSILGGNGTGKTTALSLVSGINFPYRGDILIKGESIFEIDNLHNGTLGALPQDPQSLFVKKTAYLDLAEVFEKDKLSDDEEMKIKKVSSLLGLEKLLESHPYDLSGGEKQKLALAKILLREPEILLLDEPTKGMDAKFKEDFKDILKNLSENGVTLIMVSHDIEFCAEVSSRCALFFDGNITSAGEPREFFSGKAFYTTSANRMARLYLPEAVLAEDIILACGGEVKRRDKNIQNTDVYEIKKEKTEEKKARKKFKKGTIFSALLILILIPLTIYFGVSFIGVRKYYITSFLVIIETMAAFFMAFEARKPKAREIVTISVLCAVAVAGRAAFFMLPQFKPVIAIAIISGICFGGETGFLVGAITAFVSNFFFGQGPWTPWQMFAFGIIGFVSGILFKSGFLKRAKLPFCIAGFLLTLIFYGGIMNPSSVIMYQDNITWEMIKLTYITGFAYDIIHALSTAVFLWFIAEPMIDMIERVKVKYGLIE